MDATVAQFFGENDEFLRSQFRHALGLVSIDVVLESQKRFIEFTQKLSFDSPDMESARAKWLRLLNGMTVNIGFPQLRDLKGDSDDIGDALERAREQILNPTFLHLLERYTHVEYEPAGLGMTSTPETWIKNSDIAIEAAIDPVEFKEIFFEITGFEKGDRKHHFSRSKSDGFFMMSLHLVPEFHIGHGAVDSIFRLSTLAHELGHSTTPRETSLQKLFLTFPDSLDDGLLTNDEHDSYLYERFLIENFDETSKALRLGLPPTVAHTLAKRKAVQFNSHLLKNHLTYLFFAGAPLRSIKSSFLERMLKINPTFESESDFDWLRYSTLATPLSGIGFLKAYESVFRNSGLQTET